MGAKEVRDSGRRSFKVDPAHYYAGQVRPTVANTFPLSPSLVP